MHRILGGIFFNLSIIYLNKDFQRRQFKSIPVIIGVSEFLIASMVIRMNFLPTLYFVALKRGMSMSLSGK